jgi:CBS domain-containing protein
MNADVSVREVMNREFVGVSESDSVASTARLMLEEDADCAVALRGDDPVGMITVRDVLSSALDKSDVEAATIADVMRAVPSVRSDRDVAMATDRLVAADVPGVVVIDDGSAEPVGLVTYRDIATTLTHSLRSPNEPYDSVETFPTGTNGFETERDSEFQSVCESCGTLSRSLSAVDGQLLCSNCRDV